MNSRHSIIATLFLIIILNGGCLDIFSSGGSFIKIHYVAIDIDDVFLSPNSPENVKMNAGDVKSEDRSGAISNFHWASTINISTVPIRETSH
jgi:hypothetical protein